MLCVWETPTASSPVAPRAVSSPSFQALGGWQGLPFHAVDGPVHPLSWAWRNRREQGVVPLLIGSEGRHPILWDL